MHLPRRRVLPSVAISPVAAFRSGGPAKGARPPAHHHDVVGKGRSGRRRRRSTSRASPSRPAGPPPTCARDCGRSGRRARNPRHGSAANCAGAFDELQMGQAVLERQFLDAQRLVENPSAAQRAGVDAGVVAGDHAAHARHEADAGDDAAARRALFGIGIVELVSGERQSSRRGMAYRDRAPAPRSRGNNCPRVEAVLGARRGRARAFQARAYARSARAFPRDWP